MILTKKRRSEKEKNKETFRECEIVTCSTLDGCILVGRFLGIRYGDLELKPYLVRNDSHQWKVAKDDNGFILGRVGENYYVGLSRANRAELKIYSDMIKEYEAENKE